MREAADISKYERGVYHALACLVLLWLGLVLLWIIRYKFDYLPEVS